MNTIIIHFQLKNPEIASHYSSKRDALILFLILLHLGFTCLSFFICVFFSHKIAGPLYKLQKHLKLIREDARPGNLFFRQGDYFQELADDVNETFDHGNVASKRIAFMIGHMQAEKMMRKAYTQQEKYRVLQDNITTLNVLDTQTSDQILMTPLDILFSNDYKYFSKEDIARIGYICGQMTKV